MPEQENKAPSMQKKLTDWDNEPSLLDLQADYQEAKVDHDYQCTKINQWLDNLYVEGSAKPKKRAGKSSIQPKLIRKQAEWRYSSLSQPFLDTEDIYTASPVTFEDKQAAIQNELILNNQFNTKLNKVKFINDYIRTAVDEGTVIVQLGWKYEEREVEEEVPVFEYEPTEDPAIVELMTQIDAIAVQNPDALEEVAPELVEAYRLTLETGLYYEPVETDETETITYTVVDKNCPTVEIPDYQNVIIDPTAQGDMEKASFVIVSFETSLSELKKDGRYENLDDINLENSSILAASDEDFERHRTTRTNFRFKDNPRKKIIAREYWGYRDIHGTGKVEPFVATWVGNTLIRMEETPFPDKKLPFVLVHYLPIRKSNYGEPDGTLLEDNQKVVGAVTRGMIDIMARSANGQMAHRKDALDITNKRKFDAGQDYEFNPNVDPRSAFYMHTYPEIPASAQYMLNLQNAEAESLTGVKAFASTGITGNALGETATAVTGALDATAKREFDILKRLAEGIIQIGRKIISMNAEFLSEEEVVRVTNEEFVPVKRDDLAGNIDIKLNISTAEADNAKASELAFMLQTTGQAMGNQFSQLILSEIARLRKMPQLAKSIQEFAPQPDPLDQQIKQLEIQKLQAEIAEINSRAVENTAEAELDLARVGTEIAKQDNLSSDTDLKDLNFIEQEAGVNQERELEKIDRNATNQAGLAAISSQETVGTSNTPGNQLPSQVDDVTTTNGIADV